MPVKPMVWLMAQAGCFKRMRTCLNPFHSCISSRHIRTISLSTDLASLFQHQSVFSLPSYRSFSATMCIRKSLECWNPFPDNQSASKERRVRRHLKQPHPSNWSVDYYTCHGTILRSPRCTRSQTRVAPINTARIKNYCNRDAVCRERLLDLSANFIDRNIACLRAELEGESHGYRVRLAQLAQQAYEEWESGFENHRGCKGRREGDTEFEALLRAGILPQTARMGDEMRLEADPAMAQKPDPRTVRR